MNEAERFLADLKARLARFGLTLHPDKTRWRSVGLFRWAARQSACRDREPWYTGGMTTGTPNFFDTFSADEAELMAAIMAECSGEAWAQPLITAVNENGGLTGENKARFFELRFGYSLRNAGITPRYEIPGEGDSTLDFGFTSEDQPWAVELMRLEETQAARLATHSRVDEGGVDRAHTVD